VHNVNGAVWTGPRQKTATTGVARRGCLRRVWLRCGRWPCVRN